jgi:hypothetical protein
VNTCPFCRKSLPYISTSFCPSCGLTLPVDGGELGSHRQITEPPTAFAGESRFNLQKSHSGNRLKFFLIACGVIFAAILVNSLLPTNSSIIKSPTTTGGSPLKCHASTNCFVPFSRTNFPAYGNVAPATMPDCAMAAAADFIALTTGNTPNASEIGFDFAKAGGSGAGMTLRQLRNYWQNTGISGTTLNSWVSIGSAPQIVKKALRSKSLLLVDMTFRSNTQIGNYQVSAASHAAVVDGFTPKGPLLVTWGTTIQMTWQQWNSTVNNTYSLEISKL